MHCLSQLYNSGRMPTVIADCNKIYNSCSSALLGSRLRLTSNFTLHSVMYSDHYSVPKEYRSHVAGHLTIISVSSSIISPFSKELTVILLDDCIFWVFSVWCEVTRNGDYTNFCLHVLYIWITVTRLSSYNRLFVFEYRSKKSYLNRLLQKLQSCFGWINCIIWCIVDVILLKPDQCRGIIWLLWDTLLAVAWILAAEHCHSRLIPYNAKSVICCTEKSKFGSPRCPFVLAD